MAVIAVVVSVSGCAVVGVATTVTSVAVGAVTTAADVAVGVGKATVNVVGAGVRAVTPNSSPSPR